ncbi:EAL domain-containing protein [Janthinobacterium sp. EB271-G4-7A]|uniref:EAL domain-containing protein n=1 Tax=Janthinobacterium sp. EB271-G4-7A TaxID=2775056 RepID=UPI001E31DA61|nr:EAL domain-containing protein [Janthinobacterium sp. EB271-G4-7A]MCC7696824.1 EAL domain-containing protein [Janthinobacterium sp. EB271-G4-7A]
MSSHRQAFEISPVSSFTGGAQIPFELQPIVSIAENRIVAYELLFRGNRKMPWVDVDRAVLLHLSSQCFTSIDIYVNLTNETLLEVSSEVFSRATQLNSVVFEVSETLGSATDFGLVADKVNLLAQRGVRFSVDDFGSGQDGLLRLYSLDRVESVKIDGAFLARSIRRPDAARVLCALIAQWKQNGIAVIAECVETAELLAFAALIGVERVQGWHVDTMHPPIQLSSLWPPSWA